MAPTRRRSLIASVFAVLLAAAGVVILAQATPASVNVNASQVDPLFKAWNETTPGCAVGVSTDGRAVVSRAYGMADLERDVKNTPETIFEAGSVSKQFTAAAILLLARDRKLSLDDPVRKYLPEVPEYGTPLTIRHMLNHTSGLRDWGSLEGIAGWPRTTRVYTHAHVVEILSRQRALNFPSGTRWSYSNSGFNLAAVIVARVSGMSFAEFSRTRIFEPLGMNNTSWRDDHTRIVKNRAQAYERQQSGGYQIDMPFENVHGNGGLLTTVGDLLTWNQNFAEPKVGDAAFVDEQQQPGKFTDGRAHNYAFGLTVGLYKGVRQVEHSGSTAGYRAHLSRYPDQKVSVAVLCNGSDGDATRSTRAVADLFLANNLKPAGAPKPTHTLSDADATRLAGMYRNTGRGTVITLTKDAAGVRVGNTALIAVSATKFVTATGDVYEFEGNNRVRATDEFGRVDIFEKVEAAKPSVDQLRALAGTYLNDEIETTLSVVVDGDALVIKRRPDTRIALRPLYPDAFNGGGLGTVIFRRGSDGQVSGLSVSQDRVWDLRFAREVKPAATARR